MSCESKVQAQPPPSHPDRFRRRLILVAASDHRDRLFQGLGSGDRSLVTLAVAPTIAPAVASDGTIAITIFLGCSPEELGLCNNKSLSDGRFLQGKGL